MIKKLLRKEIKEKLKSLKLEEIEKQNSFIFNKIKENEKYKNSKNICCYISMDEEINTIPIIYDILNNNKNLFIPYINDGDIDMLKVENIEDFNSFKKNKWNIYEPDESSIKNRKNCKIFFN
jgi:5-formyltetrahydrofolate cyclo-ligase